MHDQQPSRCRCSWAGSDPLMIAYHDTEWGVPVHDDRTLFEFLILEGAQAGLSWQTVLNKREGYRTAFWNFEPGKVARMTAEDEVRLKNNPAIIRNRLKISSAISNARAFLAIQGEFGDFNTYLWSFVNGEPIQNEFHSLNDIPAQTRESETLSKDLLKRGFRFVGPTICYAFMQATGMVNDHIVDCFRYTEISTHR